ncbi:MAG TPA: PD-(D/E)XK nuclease family protein [Bacteroidales bacterium]|nr:PD-(D/E)XK nuclease family protein [Bacteroidales bacterium]
MSLIRYLSAALGALPPEALKNVMVVFPNRRAGLFLRRQMSIEATSARWLPEMLSVEEAFSRWSGFGVADNLTLVVELIRRQLGDGASGALEAAAFIGHARQMAIDFDEIDHCLADPEAVFAALSEAKAAETWHPDGSPLSTYETAYLGFFRSLLHYYQSLKTNMKARGLLWPGAIAAQLAGYDESRWSEVIPEGEVWFAGFNALTPAEEKIMTTLCGIGKAKMIWDLDEYYLFPGQEGQHQAGSAIRKFMQKHPELVRNIIDKRLAHQPKKIRVVSAPGAVAQAKALGLMLMQNRPEPAMSDEAIVLADEKLLEPVLNSLPDALDSLNITMGYPLAYSPLFQLTEKIIQLAVVQVQSGSDALPLLPLIDIIRHPLIKGSANKDFGSAFERLALNLASDGSNLVYPDRLRLHLSALPEPAALQVEKLQELRKMSARMLPGAILEWLATPGLIDFSDEMTTRQFQELSRLLINLANALEASALDARDAIPLLVRQLGQTAHIKLAGEPLQGLQVMGMLETRNLAFRRVHLLSANEGSLPPSRNSSSLIPADIRRHFGLPLRNDKDAIAAYHFYQLLQNTDELTLYYNTEPDELGGGEMSRFLLQIKYELMKHNKNISWEEIHFNPPLANVNNDIKIEIPKSPAILEAISSKAGNGLSPSAISRYLHCSLQFYLNDVLGIKEKTPPGELPGYNVTGTIIHKAIELLYAPHVGKPIDKACIDSLLQNLERCVQEAFALELPGVSLEYGRNALHHAIVLTMVRRVIEFDRKTVDRGGQVTILQQEEKLGATINTSAGMLKIKGFADRIDTINSTIRVIDFKTGRFEVPMIKVETFEKLLAPEKKYAFQLACYMLMAKQSDALSGKGQQISGYILPLKYSNKDLQQAVLPDTDTDVSDAIEALLASTFEDMMDTSVPIRQTDEIKRCRYCTFIRVCNREALASYQQ